MFPFLLESLAIWKTLVCEKLRNCFPKQMHHFTVLGFFFFSFFLIRNCQGFLRVPKTDCSRGPSVSVASARQNSLLLCPGRSNPRTKTSKRAQHGKRSWKHSFGLPLGPTSAALAAEGKHAWQRLCGHCSFLSRRPCADCGKDNYNPQKTAVLRQAEGVIPRAALPLARSACRSPGCL